LQISTTDRPAGISYCASPPASSDQLSCDTAGWQSAVAAAANGINPQRPAAAAPTPSSTSMLAPASSPTGQGTAPDPIDLESLPQGPLSPADYERVGARNRYLAAKYDPDSWYHKALNWITGAMKDPANLLTASERTEHQALSAKIIETVCGEPDAEAARLDAMANSPFGAIAWTIAHEAGASQRAQDFALGLGQSVEGITLAYVGPRLKFLNVQTGDAAIAAEAAEARNGAKVAAGSKVGEIVNLPDRWRSPDRGPEARRTRRLAERALMSELVKIGAIPARKGVVLTDSVNLDSARERERLYDDMFYLSELAKVEFALTRERGQLVLRSGGYYHVWLPRTAELIAHTHPRGIRLPSRADIRRLTRWWQRVGGPFPTSDIIWGYGPAHVSRYGPTRVIPPERGTLPQPDE
jgi:hypothetical protein